MLSSGSGSQACSPLSSAVLLCCSGTCRRLPQHGCDHDEAGILCLHNSIKLLQHNRVSGLQASKALLWLLTLCVLARPQAAPAAQPGSDRSADQYMGQPERPLRAHSDPRLLPGSKHFVQISELGQGTFGTVVKALDMRHNPPQEIAIKLLPRGKFVKDYKNYVKREIENQSRLRHPLIIFIQEVFLTPTHLAIVMEYAKGGDLFNYTMRHGPHGRLAEPQARWIFQQLIIGLDYCHRRGVANRDLKLENLLLDHDGEDGTRPLLKISDFGYSKHWEDSSAKSGVGTPVYMAVQLNSAQLSVAQAPEVILGDSKYDAKKADIWSCGVIMYAMLFGKYPFDATQRNFARQIVNAQYTIPQDVVVSTDCLNMLTRVLVAPPADRLSMEDIKQHPWFLQGLPPGALDMNEFLLRGMEPFNLSMCERGVDIILDKAQRVGHPGESPLTCPI